MNSKEQKNQIPEEMLVPTGISAFVIGRRTSDFPAKKIEVTEVERGAKMKRTGDWKRTT